MNNTFNVIDEPVFWADGPEVSARLGLRAILCGCHRLRLAHPDPLQQAAVLRFLLAVSIDAFGLPADIYEWEERWRRGVLDGDRLDAYLDSVRDRLDLIGENPAWQVGDLQSVSGELKPSSLLVPAIASGNNVPLFSARTESDPPGLSLADAALGLLVIHAWDTAAIKTGAVGDPAVKGGKTTGNRTGPLGDLGVVIPVGSTLFETLMLNTPTRDRVRDLGTPWWRRPPETAAWRIRESEGLLDLLTWQSRRIRLFPESDPDGTTVVRRVLVCAGDRLASTPYGQEIHTAWRADRKSKSSVPEMRSTRHQAGRSIWRGMGGLLAVSEARGERAEQTSVMLNQIGELDEILPADFPLGVLGVGVGYGNQSAVVEHVYVDEIPLPVRALRDESSAFELAMELASNAESLRRALNDLADDVRRASGGDPVPWDKGQRAGDLLMAELEPLARRVLAAAQRQPGIEQEALVAWQQAILPIALRASDPVMLAATPQTFIERKPGEMPFVAPVAENIYRARVKRALAHLSSKEPVA